MHVKSVELVNFGPHEHFKAEFTHGLTGIFGPNGVGKSHITDGIYAALTNDFSRFPGEKASCIRDSTTKRDSSYVRVIIEHDGVEFDLLRGLRPAKHRLTVNGETYEKATDIQVELKNRLGIDKQLLDRYIIVQQWEMFAFLSDTPSERAKAFQQLCGAELAQQIYDSLDSRVKLLSKDIVDVSAQLDDSRRKLKAKKSELKENKQELKRTEQQIDQSRIDYCRDAIANAKRRQELQEQLESLTQKLNKQEENKTKGEKLLAKRQETLREVEHEIDSDDVERRLTEIHKELAKWPAYRTYEQKYAKLERALLDKEKAFDALTLERPAGVDPDLIAETDRNINECKQAASDVQAELNALISGESVKDEFVVEVKVTGDTHKISLYGGDPDEVSNAEIIVDASKADVVAAFDAEIDSIIESFSSPEKLQSLRDKHARLKQQLESHKDKKQQLWQQQKAYDDRQEKVRSLGAEIKSIKNQINELVAEAPEEPNDTEEALSAGYDQLSPVIECRERLKSEIEEIKQRLEVVKAGISPIAEQVDSVKAQIDKLPVNDNLAELKSELQQQEQLKDAKVRYETLIEQLNTTISEINDEIAELKAKADSSDRLRTFVSKLETIQSIMHRQALPKDVAMANLAEMEADINDILDQFGNPFWVKTSEDLSFDVHFPGEPARPASKLSGGQKGVLAVAFRTAVSKRFGQDIGMMLLDEPTAGMDGQNRSFLADALSTYAAQIRGKRQVVLISHADELKPSFDSLMELERS